MGIFSQLVEETRDAVDKEGYGGCYQKSVESFSKKSGLPAAGLWDVVNHVLGGDLPEKVLKRLQKSWGGDPLSWVKWWKIAQTKPDC